MHNKPKKWIAALLGVVAPPIAMMYVSQLRWAFVYLALTLLIGIGEFVLRETAFADALQLAFLVTSVVHAYRLAGRYPSDKPRPAYSRWYGLLGTTAGLFSIALGVRAFAVEPFRFPSGSMLPTVPLQSYLIVQKWGYGNYGSYGLQLHRTSISAPLSRGDIIVFEFPLDRSLRYTKRLVGLPGDEIAYRAKRLTVNGTPVAIRRVADHYDPKAGVSTPKYLESMAETEYSVLNENDSPAQVPAPLAFPFRDRCAYDAEGVSCKVPAGHYFTLGDNRDNSHDSRMWGFVPADHIVGKVLYIMP